MSDRPKMLLALQTTPSSVELVDQAAAWAARLGYVLHLVTIADKRLALDPFDALDGSFFGNSTGRPPPRETEYWLKEMADRIPATVRGGVQVLVGDVAPTLIQASKDVQLLVVGTHHRAKQSRLFLGFVTEAVVRGAECPVMVLSRAAGPVASQGPVKVRLPVDPLNVNVAGIDWLTAHLPGADATAVYVVPWLTIFGPNPREGTHVHTVAQDKLRAALSDVGHGGLSQLVVVRDETNSGDALTSEAQEAGADLLVIPTQGRSALRHAVMGSVAERIVRVAQITVVVV